MPYQLPTSVRLPRPGDQVGGFVVQDVLGEGGMGRVYRAVGSDGVPAAVKMIRIDHAGEPEFRSRFEREIRLASVIDHPHVLAVLESGTHDGMLFMTTPLVPGGSLDEHLRRSGGRLEPPEAVGLCVQIASGLGALHKAGIIHRDVKPANVLLDDHGQALVADFGIAKTRESSVLTAPGKVVGSAPYMSPEQIRGEDLDAASDVYALGCLAYELLSGRTPFAGHKGTDLLWAHLGHPVPPPDGVPDELAWALTRALEKDPAARPPTALGYARMLQVASGAARFLPHS